MFLRKFNFYNTFLLLFLSVFLNSTYAIAQNNSIPSRGDSLYLLAAKAFNVSDYNTALEYISLAKVEYSSQNMLDEEIKMHCSITTLLNLLGRYAEYKSEVVKLSKYNDRIDKVAPEIKADMYSAYSEYYRILGNIRKSASYMEKTLAIDMNHDDIPDLVSSNINLAGRYEQLGESERQIQFYENALLLLDSYNNKERYSNQTISVYRNIGDYYLKKGDYNNALKSYEKIFQKKLKGIHEDEILGHIGIARCYLNLDRIDKLHLELRKASILIKQSKLFQHEIDIKNVEYELAIKVKDYDKAIHLVNEFKKTYHSADATIFETANLELHLAESHEAAGNLSLAIYHLYATYNVLANDSIDPSIFHQQLKIDKVNYYSLFSEVLLGLGETYYKIYEKENKIELLLSSFQSHLEYFKVITKMREDYNENSSLLKLSEKVVPAFEKGIDIALELFELTNDDQYLAQAFFISENNRASLLSESIQANRALNNGSIPDSLLNIELELRVEIATLRRSIHQSKRLNLNEEIKEIDAALFTLTNQLVLLEGQIEEKFPSYYTAKIEKKDLDLKALQGKLDQNNSLLIEYFEGEKTFYIFQLDHKGIRVDKVDKSPSILEAIRGIEREVSLPPNNENYLTNYKSFSAQSYLVYKTLLAPYIGTHESLVIVADGRLNYIPFEALVTTPIPSTQVNYSSSNLKYLINSLDVQYQYSGGLFLNQNTNLPSLSSFSAFAPSFDQAENLNLVGCSNLSQLQQLQCNKEEILKIGNLFINPSLLENKEATLDNVIDHSSKSSILHLATHACIDEEDPRFNKIFLADDYLSNNDIFNLKLACEMVVLSGCETGIGKLSRGEGVMSLAKGFLQAGSESVVMSLWSVDDCNTADLMEEFYKNIKAEKTKSKSLQASKISYLKNAKKAQMHPFYWAPFVVIGNNSPIVQNQAPYFSGGVYIIAILLSLVLIILWFRSKKSLIPN